MVVFDEDTPAGLIHLVKPDILVKGGDYRPEQVIGKEDAGKVEIIQFEEGYSTTGIIESSAAIWYGSYKSLTKRAGCEYSDI